MRWRRYAVGAAVLAAASAALVRAHTPEGEQLHAALTPLTEVEAFKSIREGFVIEQGWAPTHETLAMLAAQSALETGRWRSLRGNNFGNLIETREGHPWFQFNDRRWRWYPSPVMGVRDWLRLIERRYPRAWEKALQGVDPEGFVAELKAKGYFEEPLEPYQRSVLSLWGEYLTKLRHPEEQEGDAEPESRYIASAPQGYRRARQSEVTPEMVAAAREALAEELRSWVYASTPEGVDYAIAVEEHHDQNRGWHKGASVFVKETR